MTPFLIATLLSLLVAGGLVLVFREHRQYFRQALAGVAGMTVLIVLYVIWVSYGALSRIDATSVALANIRLENVAGAWRVRTSVHNRSAEFTVSTVPLRLLIEDCITVANTIANTAPGCEPIDDKTVEVIVSIPPQQTRDIYAIFPMKSVVPEGKARYKVSAGKPKAWRSDGR